MDVFVNGPFTSPSKGDLPLEQVLQEMLAYMREKPHGSYEVIVGCDSSSGEEPAFPAVIVVLRKGEGGRFFLKRVRYPAGRKFHNLHERILQEVLLSCQLALWLRENFAKIAEASPEKVPYTFQYIHADVGENGATKDMIKEVIGLIRGNGFEARIKPDSFVASSVADRFA
ncbi:ribonuclease H-like YkuK family protein [Patescibacteria group bacterium]|nr:ribonuclease H-like YkuK family protein [Patescibacteria group bacterium]